MTKKSVLNIIIISFISISCSNEKNSKEQTAEVKKSGTQSNEAGLNTTTSSMPKGEGIVGEWSLAWEAYDNNSNKKLDEEERKKGFANRYYYKFNADGSCGIDTRPNKNPLIKGRYEFKKVNDRQTLSVFMSEQGKESNEGNYEVIELNENTMLLLESMGNLVFWEFKRI